MAEETNLYSRQIYPNKPTNSTVYGTQNFMKFVLLVPWPLPPMFMISGLMCWTENGWKKLSQKDVWENSYLPTFQRQEQPNSKSTNYDKLHKVRTAMDCLNKKLCQILSVADLPQTNRFVQHMSDIILNYTRRISLTCLCMNCCAVLWYGLWSQDWNLQWAGEWSQILENWGAWYGSRWQLCTLIIQR